MTKILIVDDDKAITKMYSIKFEELGWKTAVAHNTAEALKILRDNFKPNLILLDIIMPGENGIEFLNQLRTEKEFAKTKVVLLSNLDYQQEAAKEISSKISGYFLKAKVTPTELGRKIATILEQ